MAVGVVVRRRLPEVADPADELRRVRAPAADDGQIEAFSIPGAAAFALALLAKLGHRVVASTGRAAEAPYLTSLGAAPVDAERDDALGGDLLREVDLRDEYGYELVRCRPVDMFPHTAHIEMVSVLQKK